MSDENEVITFGNGFMPKKALEGFDKAMRKAEQQLWWPDPNYVPPVKKYLAYIRVEGKDHDEMVRHWVADDRMEKLGEWYEGIGEFYEKGTYTFVRYATLWDV